MMHEHKCKQNKTRNEVWVYDEYGVLTILGDSATGHFEHNERILRCPYCGEKLGDVECSQGQS